MNRLYAIDDGFAYTDVYDGKNLIGVPTNVVRGLREIVDMSGNNSTVAYETEGVQFTVNDPFSSADVSFDDYQFSKENRIIVHHALRLVNAPFDEPLTIALSLPFDMFFRENEDIRRKKAENVRKAVYIYTDEEKRSFEIEKVHVLPESMIASLNYFYDEELNRAGEFDNIAIIDVGGRTTDLAVVSHDLQVNLGNSGTFNHGVLDICNMILERVEKFYGGKLTVQVAQKLLEDYRQGNKCEIRIYGKQHDVTEIVSSSIVAFVDQIWAITQKNIDSIASQLDAIFMIGGGALFAGREMREKYPHVNVPEHPEFENVKGMYKFLMLQEG